MNKAIVVVQARLGSSRLPRKVFYELAGYLLIDHVLTRALRISEIYKVVLATTTNSKDDELVAYCKKKYDIEITRGSEENLFERYLQAVDEHVTDEEFLIRITADDPIRDHELTSKALLMLSEQPGAFAIVNNGLNKFPLGVETEICRINHFKNVSRAERDPYINEHIFPMYRNMSKEFCLSIQPSEDYSQFSLTVDTESDAEKVHKMMSLTSTKKNKSSLDLTWQELIESERKIQKNNANY